MENYLKYKIGETQFNIQYTHFNCLKKSLISRWCVCSSPEYSTNYDFYNHFLTSLTLKILHNLMYFLKFWNAGQKIKLDLLLIKFCLNSFRLTSSNGESQYKQYLCALLSHLIGWSGRSGTMAAAVEDNGPPAMLTTN